MDFSLPVNNLDLRSKVIRSRDLAIYEGLLTLRSIHTLGNLNTQIITNSNGIIRKLVTEIIFNRNVLIGGLIIA